MRIVLPPSETKTPGGKGGSSLEWDQLVLPELGATRRGIASDLERLCRDEDTAAAVLGLGVKGRDQIQDNLAVESAPVMPALQRYTGVLFDAFDYASLDSSAQSRADRSIWLFSALFGPLRATDRIPRYRLSCDSAIPGPSLKARWKEHSATIWAEGFTIDLRSEGYRALAPLPEGAGIFVKVVKTLEGGAAVGHANKGTKGRLVRTLIESDVVVSTAEEWLDWAHSAGFLAALEKSEPGVVRLASGA